MVKHGKDTFSRISVHFVFGAISRVSYFSFVFGPIAVGCPTFVLYLDFQISRVSYFCFVRGPINRLSYFSFVFGPIAVGCPTFVLYLDLLVGCPIL